MSAASCKVRIEALDAYLHGILNDSQHRELESHVAQCAACKQTLTNMEAETYTMGLGLRALLVPPMPKTAQDLVAIHARREMDTDTTLSGALVSSVPPPKPSARLTPRKEPMLLGVLKPAFLNAAIIGLATILGVWFMLHSHFQMADLREQQKKQTDDLRESQDIQIESLKQAQAAQIGTLQQDLRNLQNELSVQILKGQLQLQLMTLKEQEQTAKSIAALQAAFERETTLLKETTTDSAKVRDAYEKERLAERERQQLESLKAHQDELAQLTKKLQALNEKTQDQDRIIAEVAAPRVLSLNADEGITLSWDGAKQALQAVPLNFRGARIGWAMQLGSRSEAVVETDDTPLPEPGARVEALPIASNMVSYAGPAAADGRVFVGTGWNQNNLVALDGSTGRVLWNFRAYDNGAGPPAISGDGKTVYFTTESCTVYALAVGNGRRVWSRYVGDPAMTQPAVSGRLLYVVHSTRGGGRGVGDHRFPFSLTCLHGSGGGVVWSKGLNAEVATSPVVDGGKVYVTTRDGSLSVFDAANGRPAWSSAVNASSAPAISPYGVLFATWNTSGRWGFEESLVSLPLDGISTPKLAVAGPYGATYLVKPSVQQRKEEFDSGYDSETIGPEDKMLTQIMNTQAPASPEFRHEWSYLGARPTIIGDEAFAAVGDHVLCWNIKYNRHRWSYQVAGAAERIVLLGQGQPPLTPPAYAAGKLYFGSIWGDIVCLDAATGKLAWRYRMPKSHGIVSQLVLDKGHIYATTRKGVLICIDTTEPSVTGWPMWGGSGTHNGPVDYAPVIMPAKK